MAASAPIHVFLEFYKPVFHTIFFPSHCLLSDITIMKTMDSKERGVNPVGIAIINPRKEYWRSWESNQWPPVLKSATLPTELWGSSVISLLLLKMLTEPFPKGQILDTSKLKEFADDNLRFDENGNEFSKRVENTVGKGEIARYEQFLLFPQCFPKTCATDMGKPGLIWEWVKT